MTKLTLAALALVAAPSLAFAECAAGKQHSALICADSQTYDPALRACVTTSS